ncbi:hypothetical protein B0H14DRAFT_3899872 [Mycena olivaceomarginata]|nr:hypothetical protein B0H14DRAFT_3899872 [Mycena olivaceomarginata]
MSADITTPLYRPRTPAHTLQKKLEMDAVSISYGLGSVVHCIAPISFPPCLRCVFADVHAPSRPSSTQASSNGTRSAPPAAAPIPSPDAQALRWWTLPPVCKLKFGCTTPTAPRSIRVRFARTTSRSVCPRTCIRLKMQVRPYDCAQLLHSLPFRPFLSPSPPPPLSSLGPYSLVPPVASLSCSHSGGADIDVRSRQSTCGPTYDFALRVQRHAVHARVRRRLQTRSASVLSCPPGFSFSLHIGSLVRRAPRPPPRLPLCSLLASLSYTMLSASKSGE